MDIAQVNAVLERAIVSFQESEIEAMSEAAYKPKSPAAFGFKPKSKGKKCSHRNKKGDFDSYNDCVDHMSKCKKMKAADAEGLCGGVMFGSRRKSKSDDEGE